MTIFKQEKKKDELTDRPFCNVENRVVVRIWTSAYNKDRPGENVGHVSIETTQPKGYMSLWPKAQPTQQGGSGLFKPIPHEFKQNVAEDYNAELRQPEITVCLYSLNSELLFEKWETEKIRLQGWVLIGHNRLINQGSGDSCSGLAYRLLESGGIYEKLISRTYFFSTFSSVVTPDDLGKAVSVAKQQELSLHPETAKFQYVEETPIEELPIGKAEPKPPSRL